MNRKYFFKYGVKIFDSSKIEYGGFNHFIAGNIFRWKFCYLYLSLHKEFEFLFCHENQDYFYDGYHNFIKIGFLQISYGT